MSQPINWQVLARYLADESTPVEVQAVETWIDADPARRHMMDELENIWEASSDPSFPPMHDLDLDADWHRLSEAMKDVEHTQHPAYGPTRPTRTARRPTSHRDRTKTPSLQSVLNVLLVGLAIMASVWLVAELWSTPVSSESYREVIAERGERANIQLVDGTEVTLNVDSRIRMPASFDEKRVVHLEGEAYFDVATDSTRPFIVYAKGAVINVHGTAFNVRSYPEDARVQVAVVEGAVSLRSQEAPAEDEGARLEPGQMGRLDQSNTQISTQTVDMEPLLGWMEGRLVFENAPLPDVAARLERWYNLQFDIADPALDSLRLTANLKSRSLQNVLDVVAATLDIQYRIHQNTVVLADDAPRVRPHEDT